MKKTTQILISLFIAMLLGSIYLKSFEDPRVLLSILFCLIVLLLRNRCYHNFEFFLCLLIFIYFETFYLVPKFGEHYNYKQFVLPILIIYLFDLFLTGKFRFGRYGGWVIMYLVILAFGLIVSTYRGQPIIFGIKEIQYPMVIVIYFLIVGGNINININKFTSYLVIMGVAVAALVALQYIFYDKFQFIHFEEDIQGQYETGIRGLRITLGHTLIATAAVVAFAKYLEKQGNIYLYTFISLLAYIILISKTRMLVMGIIMTSVILFLIYRRFSLKAISLICIVMIIFIFGITKISSITENKLVDVTYADFEGKSASYITRVNSYLYYIDQFKKSALIGYGHLSPHWKGSLATRLMEKGIHISDIGIMHLIYENGLVGLSCPPA